MGYEEETTVNLGLPYYDSLLPEEQQEVTEAVKLLLRQTFVLERKYEKRSGRFTNNREFRICNKHLEFLRKYFAVSGVSVWKTARWESSTSRGRPWWATSFRSLPLFIY